MAINPTTKPKIKTFYQLLKPIVLKYVIHYRDDFLIHDRKYFRKHPDGQFLMAIRTTGTDIVNLDPDIWDELSETMSETNGDPAAVLISEHPHLLSEKERSRQTCIAWSTTYNKRFFYGHGRNIHRVIREITKTEAIEILNSV